MTTGTESFPCKGQLLEEWRQMLLSAASGLDLNRYFTFQMRRIGQPGRAAHYPSASHQADLLELAEFLMEFAFRHLDHDVLLPACYLQSVLEGLAPLTHKIKQALGLLDAEVPVRKCVERYLAFFEGDIRPRFSTISALSYHRYFLECLTLAEWPVTDTEDWLFEELAALNFNHVRLISIYQTRLYGLLAGLTDLEKRELLHREKCRFALSCQTYRYDPDWPCITTMLKAQIEEQLAGIPACAVPKPAPEKIGLELPVPQVALFARIIFEGGIFSRITLTGLLGQIAQTFSSKKQLHMSARSLSKNCYTTDQVTAAHVRGHLQQMIAFIDKNFFPL